MFDLRLEKESIISWAQRYPVEEDNYIENKIIPNVRLRGFFNRTDFLILCHWKTPRSKPLIESNTEDFIVEVTRIALSTPVEQLRIEIPTLLKGVSWPTASVLLHFGHTDPYPIIDFRALWSLRMEKPPSKYDFDFWWQYVQFSRQLATELEISMRELDRALWQYSKENQKNYELDR